ncbi:MAG: PIN domain-containing protein [Nitrospinae bacterium]|nr:PIN domain-containing protein [Nitrospinota bacterium]
MPADIRPIDSFEFRDSGEFLVDTNIWLYIFGPQAPDNWETRIYSKAYAGILSAKSHVYIDPLILSEFINRYARLIYRAYA